MKTEPGGTFNTSTLTFFIFPTSTVGLSERERGPLGSIVDIRDWIMGLKASWGRQGAIESWDRRVADANDFQEDGKNASKCTIIMHGQDAHDRRDRGLLPNDRNDAEKIFER